jgi:hypothetical protein
MHYACHLLKHFFLQSTVALCLEEFYIRRVTVFIKEPDISYSAPKQIVSPFSTRLWQTVGLTVLIISVLLSALSYNNTETVNYRIYSSIFYVFYILCQQCKYSAPLKHCY